MNVLQIVTTEGSFFNEQIRVLERNGVSCTVVATPNSGGRTRSVRDYASCYRSVLEAVWGGDFDLVHANYGLTVPLALAQPLRPVVCSLWGSDVFGTYSAVSKLSSRAADEVIVMSEEMAAEVGGDPTIIPHGVDFDRFKPAPQRRAQDAVGWEHSRKHVLFPWPTSREVKDYPRAERVVSAVRERLSTPVELQVVSGVDHDRMSTYMNAADALLMTSKWEGSPNSVREALACNLPVVATDVGDVREHVTDLPLSQVCRTDEELVDALSTVLESDRPTDSREQIRDLSLEQMGKDLLEVYDRALS
jgi:glycosyltransferase involved in cell wall biosynthesis